MVLRILGCRIGGRNWLSKIGFKIEIPLPEHLLDSGGWKEKRKKFLKKGRKCSLQGFWLRNLGLETQVSSWFKGEEKECFGFLNEWKKKIGTRLLNRFGLWKNLRIQGERKHGGRKLGETKWKSRMGGEKVERQCRIVNGFLRRKLDAIWQGNAWNCDSESRSGMTQQDEKTWKKYLGREEKKKKSGAIVKKKSNCLCFLEPQKIKSQKVCIWKDSEFDFFTEKKFGVISNRAEFGFGFPLNEEWKTKTRLENSLKIDFRWASLLGRQICETVTQVSKARLGEDRNLAWTARRKAGLTKLFSKEIRLETRA